MYLLRSTAFNINKENFQVIFIVETMLLKQPSYWKPLLLETNNLLNMAIITRSVVFKPQLGPIYYSTSLDKSICGKASISNRQQDQRKGQAIKQKT